MGFSGYQNPIHSCAHLTAKYVGRAYSFTGAGNIQYPQFQYRMMKQWYILLILLLLTTQKLSAQEFKVRSFHLLRNDITAWMNPVRDLNQEACALIKVVADPDFEFSTPLGIVLRKNKTGESWLYIPNGSIQINIKHARWGVLRDYQFPVPLESRLTYEMIIDPPLPATEKEKPIKANKIRSVLPNFPLEYTLRSPGQQKLFRHPPSYFISLNIGQHDQETSYGLLMGFVKKSGIYVHFQSNFHFLSPDGKCDKTGFLPGGEQSPYYTGTTKQSHYMITTGGIHRIAGLVHIYEGIGYGNHTVVWETLEKKQLKNTHYSTQGITVEIGCLIKIRHLVASLGLLTIQGKYWEPVIGIGIHF